MSYRSVFLFVFCLLISGCGVNGPGGGNQKTVEELLEELTGVTWQLESIHEQSFGIYAPETDTLYSVRFFEDGTFEAASECNTCNGNYEINKNYELTTSNMECTLRSCQTVIHSHPYSSNLQQAGAFLVQNGQLFITSFFDESFPQVAAHKNANSTAAKRVIMANPDTFNRSDWPGGIYDVTNASLARDTLVARIEYSGCDPNDFNLVFNDYFIGALPAEAHAVLTHRDEPCDAVFMDTLRFDLTNLRNDFEEYYGDGPSEIKIVIREGDDQKAQLLYDFFK